KPIGSHLERGRIYEGGNLHELERLLGITGDRILYVGDHIYGDILRSKKESVWRTAMIVQEMEAEVAANDECAADFERHGELEERRGKLEDELRFFQARYKDVARQIETAMAKGPNGISVAALSAERVRAKRQVERVRGTLREIEK